MFNLKKNTNPSNLDIEIARVLKMLSNMNPVSDEYAAVSEQYAKLMKLKEIENSQHVSKEKLADIAASIAGILIIVSYEKTHVIVSKAMGHVFKVK